MTERGEPPVDVAGPGEVTPEPAAPPVAAVPAALPAAAPVATPAPAPQAGSGLPQEPDAVPAGRPEGTGEQAGGPRADGLTAPEPPSAGVAGEGPVRRVSTWNIANALTIARLAIVPVFTVFLFVEGEAWRLAALGVFLLASLTDQLDGWLARKYALITDFGKIADPIADKALIGAALLSLSYLGEIPWWVTLVIIAREAGVTLLRFLVIRHGVIPASYGGKVKTVLQIAAIALYIVPGVPDLVRWAAMGLALLVTVGTGADYVVRAVRLRQVARSART
ncbi:MULTISPECIES: CDP-diacylglycerol--glycerol-3-phosphate 3-phosphatidyltransferase [unclassified Microbispora]|uniref:CDP-diacylglycerol--glycerol-3-phosphate 3-phosphatidyltransferase n=1 Tax=unclassified Microbispora TaxID=2614687 RepID=UPI001B8D7090|nr:MULTISPECIES: CDP-diacylglycerol--glycerol-3-phosphate 3-phosphatidyltransferase [unclassified Microbispora]